MRYTFILIICLSLLACEKKEESTPAAANNNTTTGVGTTNNDSNPNYYYGVFTYEKKLAIDSNSVSSSSYYYNAVFYDKSTTGSPFPNNFYKVDSVAINGTYFTEGFYSYSLNTTITPFAFNWHIISDSIIPSFDYVANDPLPICNVSLPDSISITDGLNLNLTGCSGFSGGGSLNLMAGSQLTTDIFNEGVSTLTIAPSRLANFSPPTNGKIIIKLTDNKTNQVGGKYFKFSNAIIIEKIVKMY